jgi:5'-nucleotidase (lipoprotein e(P4) family)
VSLRHLLLASALLAGCATAQTPTPQPAPVPQPAPPAAAAMPNPPAAMQWLYGSGEGGAASQQAYNAFLNYVIAQAEHRPHDSVVLAADSTLDLPNLVPCGDKPLAVILDVDETALQNLGYEYDDATHPGRPYDQERWNRWERTGGHAVLPMPGAVIALERMRHYDVTVIFNSNRMATNAAATEAALNDADLGPAVHGRTLWLQGDVAPGSAKDPRRAAIAQRYCVVAMAGDQLGDFSDLFNARTLSVQQRRHYATTPPFRDMWGQGWFILPNPVYGSGLRGNLDDIFPADRRWSDPQGGNR